MTDAPLSHIRNIGVMAHIDAGKTTVTERVLFHTGRTRFPGEVDHGTATMDWMAQEQERGITITAAATTCAWRDTEINLIDTPGHIDFKLEVERSLRVLDGAISVVCGVRGVQSQTETVWRQANQYRLPRVAFINKMDREGADFEGVVAELNARLRAGAIAVQWPIFGPDGFEGVVDLIDERELRWDPATYGRDMQVSQVDPDRRDELEAIREELIAVAAGYDEALEAAYLEDLPIDAPALRAALRRGCLAGEVVPVLCGSAFKHQGIQPLLDAVVAYLPSPADAPPATGYSAEAIAEQRRSGRRPGPDDQELRPATVDAPLVAFAFKQMLLDDLELTFVRIYAGRLRQGDTVLNVTRGTEEQIAELGRVHANHYDTITEANAGSIVVVTGLGETLTGDTLTSPEAPIWLERLAAPDAVITRVIEVRTEEDAEPLALALKRFCREDPALQVGVDPETGQTLIRGLGELHLEIVADRLIREHRLGIRVGQPKVALREGITAIAQAAARYEHPQARHAAEVEVEVRPSDPGTGVSITWAASAPDDIATRAVGGGVREACDAGVILGRPMIDLSVAILGGSFDSGRATPAALATAARRATVDALRKAAPRVLEPVFTVEVEVPEEYMGVLIGDLTRRRGRVTQMSDRAGWKVVSAEVPLAELLGYATAVRSMTKGRATFSMDFDHYAPAPTRAPQA